MEGYTSSSGKRLFARDSNTGPIDAGPRSRLDTFYWWAAVAVVAVHCMNLARFAIDWPLHDDYTQILAIPGYLVQLPTWREKLDLLFALAVEHRIVTLRLAGWLGSLVPGGLDFRLLIFVGNLLGAAAGALAVLAFPRSMRACAALLAALLLTSPASYGAQYWATGALQHFGVSAYAMASLFALGRRWPPPLPFLVALLAAFTSANGLMTFPAAIVMLIMSQRRREALAWTIATLVLVAVYFIGYEVPAGRAGIGALVREPLQLAAFGLSTLGALGGEWKASIGLGLAVVAVWSALLVSGAWRRVPPWVVAVALFFAMSCAAIAVGRAALGSEASMLPRYRVYSALAILSTAAALLSLMTERASRVAGIALVTAAFSGYAIACLHGMHHIVELAMVQAGARDHFAAEARGFYGLFPTREFGDFTLDRAREIGRYDGARHAGTVIALVPASPGSGPAATRWHTYVEPGDRVITVGGWLAGGHASVDLWLDDGHRAFRAPMVGKRFPLGAIGERRTAFHGTVRLEGLPAGHYRVGFAGSASPGVAWTAQRFDRR